MTITEKPQSDPSFAIDAESRRQLDARARTNLSSMPRPFLRWAGSKRALVQHLVAGVPDSFGTYYEPFLGSGAMFFLLTPERAVLNDTCEELVDTYRQLAKNPQAVIDEALSYPVDSETFYRVRSTRHGTAAEKAGRFIYLNHTCFNGLYRVNLRGEFNVPFGRPKSSHVLDTENVLACSAALSGEGISFSSQDFEESVSSAEAGDFVFLDPPYVTRHNNNGFIEYNEKIFSWQDQQRLAGVAADLVTRGCRVVITNAAHVDVIALYPQFRTYVIDRPSTIASNRDKRGRTFEAVFIGGEGEDRG